MRRGTVELSCFTRVELFYRLYYEIHKITSKANDVLWYNIISPLIDHAVEEVSVEPSINTTVTAVGKRFSLNRFGQNAYFVNLIEIT